MLKQRPDQNRLNWLRGETGVGPKCNNDADYHPIVKKLKFDNDPDSPRFEALRKYAEYQRIARELEIIQALNELPL